MNKSGSATNMDDYYDHNNNNDNDTTDLNS